ncbi:bifunctional diguanylate cyclase/phosphodiesterase [Massilia sp. MS-15]|uniref:putative bifunctional diguanylate cyclase/phosphodiesterase n=1 Tax=Massilia sp. MS-15 TaxID=2878200 RepID=UPI001CD79D60|nr:EAL domain-containing protein [Massilia sp. MS-15]MCA1248215.1 EAL domain-containing protein [Massilia sp. MS-15]
MPLDTFLHHDCALLAAHPAPDNTLTQESNATSILDELRQVVFQTDRAGRWTFLNRAWEALTSCSVATALGASCLAYIHPDDRAREQGRLDQLLLGQRDCCRHEVRYLRADGQVRWVDVFARAQRDVNGVVTGTVGTLFDVTERKRACEQSRLAAGVFASAGEGILVTSADGRIVDVNQAFEAITGYARAEVLGKNPSLLSSGRQGKEFYADMWRRIGQAGSWSGEVWNRRKSGELYVERLTITAICDEAGQLSHHVGVFADITRQKRQAEHLEHIAHYDPLTGLANRRLLADRLQQAMGRARRNGAGVGAGVAVASLDLDDFKKINELHGHECGDELLVTLARRIQEVVRDTDTVCRPGGDEFVAVFDGVDSLAACQPMVARLLRVIAEPVSLGGATVCVSASAGLAFYPQSEDVDADQLIRQADQAMFDAKMGGKNRYFTFDTHGYREMIERAEEIEALERAIAGQEFTLHYQPIVHLKTGQLNSVEALVRWNHPTRGCLAPGSFLPTLEGHPLMLVLENWILAEAFRQHEHWLDEGLDIAISVNMSGAQLRRKDLVQHVRGLLAAHPRVNPRRIKLEVLESSALEDMGHVSNLIRQCAEIGIGFALDDFGTGYSSLRYLKQLPARRIKIDQGFVRDMLQDPDDLAILEGVIGMAAAFKREVVAEGVETEEHAAMLVQLGCMLAQGYGIARPMPAQAVAPWLANWRLPSSVASCAPLDRDDTLLLKALVEQRAWHAGLTAASGEQRRCQAAVPNAIQTFNEWLDLNSAKPERCRQALASALACRDAFLAQLGACAGAAGDGPGDRPGDGPGDAPGGAVAAMRPCQAASQAFAAALKELLDAWKR